PVDVADLDALGSGLDAVPVLAELASDEADGSAAAGRVGGAGGGFDPGPVAAVEDEVGVDRQEQDHVDDPQAIALSVPDVDVLEAAALVQIVGDGLAVDDDSALARGQVLRRREA